MGDKELTEGYKADLRVAYDKAIAAGFKQTKIAEHSGVPEESIKAFLRTSALGRDNCLKLEAWLQNWGFFGDKELWEDVATELRNIADILANPKRSDEFKKSRIKTLIKVLVDADKEHRRVANERLNGLERNE